MTRVCYSFYERCMNMINVCDVGKRIKELRISSNLTQDKIAEYLSLNQSMIAKMEKGERNIMSDVIEKLSALFCCTVEYLLFGEQAEQQCVISFRKNKIVDQDLKVLAKINKIVLNQFEIDQLLETK